MEKTKKPFYKKWWFWVLAFLFLLVMGNMNTGPKEKQQEVAPIVETSSEEAPEVEEDPVLAAFAKATGIKEASITQKDDYIEIVYTLNSTPYDYSDYVSTGLTHFVKTARQIYESTDCDTLRMDMQVDGSAITSLIITKDNFESIDWSSLAYLEGTYEQIQGKFQKFYVESVLMKGVDTNRIMYKGD